MIEAIRKRRDQEGFTLIELMVVVLIIGILVAIAVPTFLNAQNNAKSKAAQSNARTSLSAAKTVHAEQETYDVTLATLQDAEPSLDWVAVEADPSVNVDDISWDAIALQFRIAVRAKNNDCFFIRDNVDATAVAAVKGTTYGKIANAVAGACVSNSAVVVYQQSQALGWPKTGNS